MRRAGVLAAGVLLALLVLAAPLRGYLLPPVGLVETEWRDVGASPRAEEGYLPQGLSPFGAHLLASAYHPRHGSILAKVDPANGATLVEWRMPPEATHTSGVAWDGARAWALDYDVGRLYALTLPPEGGDAVVEASYPTGLGGASALGLIDAPGGPTLALSDFGYRARTYLLPVGDAPRLQGERLADVARVSYRNGEFSQGLAWDGARLIEAVNHAGRDVLRVLDVADALQTGDSGRVAWDATLSAPGDAVEGIALLGGRLFCLDEGVHRLSVTDAPGPLHPRRV